MKRILFAIVMFAFSTVLMPGMSLVDSDNTKTRIETDTQFTTGTMGYERTIHPYVLEVYLLNRTGEVEFSLFNIGVCEVYIIDNSGQTVDYSSVDTEIPSTVYLSTNGPGYYSVVVVSDICYAQGHFTL